MRIEELKLVNFRSYGRTELEGFGSRINLVTGGNAQGKTNLLEAMYLASVGRSFRLASERTFVKEGESAAYVRVAYVKGGSRHTLELMIGSDRRKSFKKDGVPAKAIREIIGNLLMVSFSPEDIRTAQESPQLRRSLLDSEISKIRPAYVDALKQYAKIVQEKNRVLKAPPSEANEQLLRIYNEQAAPYIHTIVRNRNRYVEKLAHYVQQVQEEISGGSENVELRYRSTIPEDRIGDTLDAVLSREKAAMCSVSGPHRDDLLISLNGRDVREFASQGQLRSVMLAIKIACVRVLRDASGHMPILLLDDVFSELDPVRKQNLLSALGDMQVFITSADPSEARLPEDTPCVRVADQNAAFTADSLQIHPKNVIISQ